MSFSFDVPPLSRTLPDGFFEPSPFWDGSPPSPYFSNVENQISNTEEVGDNTSLFTPWDRTTAVEKCQDIFRVTPKDLQLQVVECFSRGQDCILVAGCGWGKTVVYFLPLVLWSVGTIVVISPLKALIREQQGKLDDLKIPNISFLDDKKSVNDDTMNDLVAGRYRAVFLTPEIIFESRKLKALWSRKKWQNQLQAIVLDEAHCVVTWGADFRKSYGRIGDLRAKVLPRTAFVAVSATLAHEARAELREKVLFGLETLVIDVGNDRKNVRLEVRPLQLHNKYKQLDFVLDFQKTLVYFEKRKETTEATEYLESLARIMAKKTDHTAEGEGHTLVGKIACYHAGLSELYKAKAMDDFKTGKILILLATEAAGMGCDIPDIARVVQFKSPKSISCLVQRLGRAARNPELDGIGILFAEKQTKRTTCDDPHLTQYIATKGCRRKILDELYGNKHPPNPNCCDICHPKSMQQQTQQPFFSFQEPKASETTIFRSKVCTAPQKELAITALKKWRTEAYKRDLEPTSDFSTELCIMNDRILKKLGERFAAIEDKVSIDKVVSWCPFQASHLEEVANILIALNQSIDSSDKSVFRPSNILLAPVSAPQPLTKFPKRGLVFKNTTPADVKKARK